MAADASRVFDVLARFTTDLVAGPSRDSLDDVLNDAFGRSYSIEMKGLLRKSYLEGLTRGGIAADELDGLVDPKAIEVIWRTQRQYTTKLKNDLKTELNAGRIDGMSGLERWFGENDYRSVMTGRFMAWQGLNAGLAKAADSRGKKVVWELGLRREHCHICDSRHGQTFTYEELRVIGFPASDRLPCKSACGCRLVEV